MNHIFRDRMGLPSVLTLLLLLLIPLQPLLAAGDIVRVQLLWKHQFQFAGYYMAKEKGFYKQQGIEPEFLELSSGEDPADVVTRGDAEFGIGRSSLVVQRLTGSPVVALLAAFQQSPLMLMSRADSGIQSPADLKGKRVEITLEAQQGSEIIAMLLKYGVTLDDIVLVQHSFALDQLTAGETDAVGSYISNEPYAMSLKGIEVNQIHPQDHGFPMYSDILFTSENTARTQPDLVQRFKRATVQGWLYAFDHIDETVALIMREYNSQERSQDALTYEAESLKALAFDDMGLFGSLEESRFQAMANVYRLTGQLDGDIDLSGFVFCCSINPENSLQISLKERQNLAQLPKLTVCVEQDWMPFSGVRSNDMQGIIVDYTQQLFQSLGLKYQWRVTDHWHQASAMLHSGQCDILSGVLNLMQGNELAAFSKPFFSMPMVAASRNGEGIESIALRRGRVGFLSYHGLGRLLEGRHPGLKLREIASVAEGLRQVQNGDLDTFIDAEASIAFSLREANISNLVIDASIQDSWDLGFTVAEENSYLLPLLERSMDSLEAQFRNEVATRWLPLTYKPPIDPDDLERLILILVAIAAVFGYRYYAIQKNNRILEKIVHADPLTGAKNRYAMQQQLQLHINLAARSDRPLSVIFLDIDNFKQINDHFGHSQGDKVLIAVCEALQNGLRITDQLGRWGGEEFLVVLPDTDIEGGSQVAEKLRQHLKSASTEDFKLPTCSFGVAEWQTGESQDDLVRRADNALYQAKYRGKDMVRQAFYPIPSKPMPIKSQPRQPY
ncbi:ABC transporter substrate-binding protein [Pontibacter sp. JAM-7]|uniref:ABC transporter substrate-binding protein n=1 Tax=Pontibacter sp. JAM-7 TaxID=3366581 RepID=UPI003AF599BB